ncbi:MAG TPA: PIG-L deacetylase family protein [Candidatus Obscuribacterales bacterium]
MRVMIVGAHPDDAEFGCGGTIAKWAEEGAEVFLLVATNGDKGDDSGKTTPEELAQIRLKEQKDAAGVLKLKQVEFLPHADGSLIYSTELRGDVVFWIRSWKPDVLFSHDPEPFIHQDGSVNHADHRAIGAAALDAVYPFARGRHQYPEHFAKGLQPHVVPEVYLWSSNAPNYVEDIGAFLEQKIEALLCHKSQFPDAERTRHWVREAAVVAGKQAGLGTGEAFRRILLK